jgi:hypothetical protein
MAIAAGVPEALGTALDECLANELLPEEHRDKLVAALTVNVVQAIDQVAEHPKGRRYFKSQGAFPKLEQIEQSAISHVRKHAAKALAQVTWTA